MLHIWRYKSVTITFTNFKRSTLPSYDIDSGYIMITGHPGREWSINHRTDRCFTGHVRRTDEVWDSLLQWASVSHKHQFNIYSEPASHININFTFYSESASHININSAFYNEPVSHITSIQHLQWASVSHKHQFHILQWASVSHKH